MERVHPMQGVRSRSSMSWGTLHVARTLCTALCTARTLCAWQRAWENLSFLAHGRHLRRHANGTKFLAVVGLHLLCLPLNCGCFPVVFAVLFGEHPAREVTIRFGRTVIGLACNHVTSVTSAHGCPRAALVRGSMYICSIGLPGWVWERAAHACCV